MQRLVIQNADKIKSVILSYLKTTKKPILFIAFTVAIILMDEKSLVTVSV